MKRYLKWTIAFLAIVLGAWALSTLLQVVAITKESQKDREHLNDAVRTLQADNKHLQRVIDEANRRCVKAKDCTPVPEPEINIVDPDEPENQESEFQEPEFQEPERQENEIQEPENPDDEVDNPEEQESEIQEPEIQDEEIQDAEKDDPDPASPFTFSFIFEVPGNGESGPTKYRITCNSGTEECTAEKL